MLFWIQTPQGTHGIRVPRTDVNELFKACESSGFGDSGNYRLVHRSRDLRKNYALSYYGITEGDTIQMVPRLLGGEEIELNVKSSFGCWLCTGKCFCMCCNICTSRKFKVRVRKIDSVQVIWDKLKEQNPKITPGTLTNNNEMLEPDRKILFYKLQDGDTLQLQLIPTKMFMGGPKKPKPPPNIAAEVERAKSEVKEAAAGDHCPSNVVDDNKEAAAGPSDVVDDNKEAAAGPSDVVDDNKE